MTENNVELTMGVTFHKGTPFIETRARAVGRGGPVPRGKVLVMRTPILPPGTPQKEVEALTESELIDDHGAFCPHCADLKR